MKIFTIAEMVAAEKAADAAGVSYAAMMEAAGKGVADALIARRSVMGVSILVLVGPGNNGGDGLVAGRYLAEAGAEVVFYLYQERDPASDANLAAVSARGLPIHLAGADPDYRDLRQHLDGAGIVVDALLGTGVSRPVGGELAQLMQVVKNDLAARRAVRTAPTSLPNRQTPAQLPSLNKARPERYPLVAAVDCPSGLNSDSGELDPLTFPADLTVTFAGPKRGHFIFPGAAARGELVVVDIGIAPRLPEVDSVQLELLTAGAARALLPPRPLDGHKGTFGAALIAAGSDQYWGAPILAGRAAYRAGAGLVALAVPSAVRPVAAGRLPEATYPPLPDTAVLGQASARFLLERLDRYDALAIGPGLADASDFVMALLAATNLPPLLIDADGLNALAAVTDWPRKVPPQTILTPHPGEMARLLGVSPGEVKQADRVALARRQAAEWGCILLLKGAYTVVAAPDGRCRLIPFANPVLGTAGSGDVLSGVIVSLLAQGVGAYDAAVLGAYWHGAAGQLAGDVVGQAGVMAGEIADWLPEVRQRLAA